MVGRRTNLKYEPKLTWEQVSAIRRDYRWHSREAGCAALAKRYGVSTNTIHKIIRGKVWRVRTGDGNQSLPQLRRPSWKALAVVDQKIDGHLAALMRLVQ
ncbi:hypothetical protein ASC89_00270 [Devosia sp. Root413D1]|nr:hypothetical protein ASC89_00270 [Devosia sp. Root413D1]